MLSLANEAEGERAMQTNEVERLTKELVAADDFAAEKERDFINAKEARRVLATQLAEAKCACLPAVAWGRAHAPRPVSTFCSRSSGKGMRGLSPLGLDVQL